MHGPRQYEIVLLSSVNAENQEWLFQQAKPIAANCTNTKPENVLPTVLFRLKAKHITGKLSHIYHSAKSKVKNAASKIPAFAGTAIDKSFINERSHSWQAHLRRISSFLIPSVTPTSYVFF